MDLARRCAKLGQEPEFLGSGVISLIEDEAEGEYLGQDGLGVYELEECELEDEEDPTELYVSGEQRFEEPTSAVEEATKEINLGTEEDPKPVLISANLVADEERDIVKVLKEYLDSFAWSYEDMPGLDPSLVEHRLVLKPDAKPLKQRLRRLHPGMALKVKEEVDKLHNAKFIRVVLYPQWVANIVPVMKKDGRVRICIDFRDLNRACPKDDFPLPHIDVLIDNTAGYEMLSFMDGFSGYNQIRLAKEDQEKTSFTTPWGTYCYVVMPFGLKNAGATYQRAMMAIFHDMMHVYVEVYVDDILVKSRTRAGHAQVLQAILQRAREHQLKMNPKKCVFGVSSGKLLGFIVSKRGIEIDPNKAKAISALPPPRNLKELRGLIGRLQFIRRFVSQHSLRCKPFYDLLKGGAKFEWNNKCQEAFEGLKKYLLSPPTLMPPVPGRPLLLYVSATEESAGAVLAQYDDEKKERAVYYLSKLFNEAEQKYSAIERTCAALVWVVQKLKHYFLAHEVKLLARMDPIRYLLEKPVLTDRLVRWQSFLNQFDITYVNQKAIKGQAIAEHLAHHPLPVFAPVETQFPDEELKLMINSEPSWVLYFDGAINSKGKGIGIVLLSPEGVIIPQAFQLTFQATNNIAEYEALLNGLKLAITLNITKLRIIGDSQLILRQVLDKYKTRDPKLKPYQDLVQQVARRFRKLTYVHTPRSQNVLADSLASLASSLNIPLSRTSETITLRRMELPSLADPWFDRFRFVQANRGPVHHEILVLEDEEFDDGNPWFHDLEAYCRDGSFPEYATASDRRAIRRMAQKYKLIGGLLYRKSLSGVFLRCLKEDEYKSVMEMAHASECGGHINGRMLARRILKLYYWPSLEEDCTTFVRHCHQCQLHADKIHAPSSSLHPIISPWPFAMWAFDVVGPLEDRTGEIKKKSFILTATEYFTKWAEAEAFAEIKASTVVKFIKRNIIARFGVPQDIVTDNGPQFISQELREMCCKFGIHLHHSSPYYPQGNGQAEATNKTLIRIVKRTCNSHNYADWAERLVDALWAYRTTIRTPTGQTPYALTFGMDAVLPYEIIVPSLRVQLDKDLHSDEHRDALLAQLELLDEKRMWAADHAHVYRQRIARFYEKKVIERKFERGDLVLKRRMLKPSGPRSKLSENWEGPFVVKEAYAGNAYQLVDADGVELSHPWNGVYLKKYFP